jgi:hypothetical protein
VRRISFVALGVASMVAMATPAGAKVAGSATISGPGIGGGGSITMGGTGGGRFPMMTGLFDPGLVSGERPPGALGPRYVSTYVIEEPAGQPAIVQHLYPFADGGPLVYTPRDQEWLGGGADGTARSGWFRAPPELVEELRARGLPAEAPSSGAASSTARSPGGNGSVPWTIGVFAAMLLVAAVAARRRDGTRAPLRAPTGP